jgi:fatty acid desaturase
MGVSGGWWFGKHHRHHAHPNNIALDPDVRVSFFSYAPEQQHEKQGIRRISSRFQHILYFPMATLQAWSLHFAGTLAIIRDRSTVRRPGWELAFLFVHAMAYFVVLATVLSLVQFVVFVFVHQAVFGVYLASTFAPNHKGMAMFTEEPPFLRHQVLTARNVTGGGVVAFLTGGLNYQIEHHLFPAMPRPNLKRAQPIVQEFCEEIGLSYAQANVWKSFGLVTDFFRRECLR